MALSDNEVNAFLDGHTDHVGDDSAVNDFLDGKTSDFHLPSSRGAVVQQLQDLAAKAAPQAGQIADAALSPMGTLLRAAPDMVQRASNFVQGQPNQPAQTVLQAAGNRPDITAGAAVSMIPGGGLSTAAARILGASGAAAINPDNRGANAASAGGLQAILEALPYGAGKIAPGVKAIMQKASGVDSGAIQKLFENPSLLWTGPSMQEARQLYADTAAKVGLSPEVSDNVLFQSGKRFVKNVLGALNEGQEVPTQTLLDARQATSDLIETAKRTGASNEVKGFTQRYQDINAQIAQQAPELRQADKVFSQAATRDQFLNVLPHNANGTPSVGKLTAGGVVGELLHLAGMSPLATGAGMATTSPMVQGIATSAAGAVAKNPRPINTGLQAIRQYLLNKAQNGPAS